MALGPVQSMVIWSPSFVGISAGVPVGQSQQPIGAVLPLSVQLAIIDQVQSSLQLPVGQDA